MTERDIIAEIKLAPGEIGYYDDYSRIYLTRRSPNAFIYAGTNTTQIIRSVASGRLLLVNGTFDARKAKEKKEAEMIRIQAEQERKIQAAKMAEIADAQAKEEAERILEEKEKEAPAPEPEPEKKVEAPVEKTENKPEEVEPEKHTKRVSRRSKKADPVVKEEAEEASK